MKKTVFLSSLAKLTLVSLLIQFILVTLLNPVAVIAQEATDSTIYQDQNGVIWQRESLQQEIAAIRAAYRARLESYRTKEKAFQIAKDQYQAHQTLVSIEEAVKATQAVMLARVEVLQIYTQLLKLKLIEAEGVNLDEKETSLTRLDAVLAALEAHQAVVEQTSNREQINQLTLDFKPLTESFEESSYQALNLLAIAKLQSVYDKAVLLKAEIAEQPIDETNQLRLAERNRASQETDKILASTQVSLKELWVEVAKARETGKHRGLNRRLRDELDSIYVDLAKVISYLNELLIY